MSKKIIHDDLFEIINKHKNSISQSFLFYRPKAKAQKIIVLESALKFLSGEITKQQLNAVIAKCSSYADAIGNSKTKKLVEDVLKKKPFKNRTQEGYIKN